VLHIKERVRARRLEPFPVNYSGYWNVRFAGEGLHFCYFLDYEFGRSICGLQTALSCESGMGVD